MRQISIGVAFLAFFGDWAPTNLYLKADGTVNNIDGFGTVNGMASARNLQTVIRFQF